RKGPRGFDEARNTAALTTHESSGFIFNPSEGAKSWNRDTQCKLGNRFATTYHDRTPLRCRTDLARHLCFLSWLPGFQIHPSVIMSDGPTPPASQPPSPSPSTKPPARFDASYVTAMSHFYRGEMQRIMSWRQRLDVTTSWAITVTSTIFTVAFSVREVPHIIFFFNVAVVWALLWIEARRHRFYDAVRARVRIVAGQ